MTKLGISLIILLCAWTVYPSNAEGEEVGDIGGCTTEGANIIIKQLSSQLDTLDAYELESQKQLNGVLSFQSEYGPRFVEVEKSQATLVKNVNGIMLYGLPRVEAIKKGVSETGSNVNALIRESKVLIDQVSDFKQELQLVRENLDKLSGNQENVVNIQKSANELLERKLNEVKEALKVLGNSGLEAINNANSRFNKIDGDISLLTGTTSSSFSEISALVNKGFSTTVDTIKNGKKLTCGPVIAADCFELLKEGQNESGVYNIYPRSLGGSESIEVYCDMTTNGGGWTVIQRRDANFKPRIDFYRGWAEYKNGFGNVDQEFWLGLDKIRALTTSQDYKLRVDMSDFDGGERYAEYSFFSLAPPSSLYQLSLGDYEGNAGNSMSYENGMKFSTKDRDHDTSSKDHCAQRFHGAWWYNACHKANINGFPYEGEHETFADGINWEGWRGYHYSLKTAEMKLRPVYE